MHSSLSSLIMVVLGANAMLLQATAVREFLAVFSGNELGLGITLSLWLLTVGAGSMAAARVRGQRALGVVVLVAGLLAPPLFSLIPVIRPLLAYEAGEIIPLGTTIIATSLLLTPVCILIGMQFPLAVRSQMGSGPRVFLLEGVGAFLGGTAFSFLLAGRVDTPQVLTGVSMAFIAISAVLLGRRTVALLIALPLLLSNGLVQMQTAMREEAGTVVSRTGSRYGTIEVTGTQGQLNIFAGGKFQFSYPDKQTDELRIHLPLTLHPAPRRVLVAGGSPAAALEVLKYPGVSVDLVELDPELLRVSLSLLGAGDREAARDPRMSIVADDARRYIKGLEGPRYDLMVLNLPEPTTANLNRLYTVEFFREAQRTLNKEGVLTLTLPASFGYVGKRMQAANGAVVASLQAVFPHVVLSSEEYGLAAASDSPIGSAPALLQQRVRSRDIGLAYFHPYLLDDAFDPLKVERLRARLAGGELNRDDRPIAYRYHLLVWADTQRSGILQNVIDHGREVILAVLVLLALAGAAAGKGGQGISYSVFLAGFTAMAFSLVVLLAYQSAFGYVYERIGLLSACFMAGSALGAHLARGRARPLRLLMFCEVIGAAVLSLAPLLFRAEPLYVLLMALGGALGGAVFVTAVERSRTEDAAGRSGRLYGLDLAGSFLGALLTALILVPLFGTRNTLLGMVLLKTMSLTVLLWKGNEQA